MYYQQEKTASRITINTIAKTGGCNFVCRMCEIEDDCIMYNHQSEPVLNQRDFRIKMAGEYLKRNKNANRI